ncbi:MAG: CDP-alcohol phosphatidyltransferase family protein [Chloroflexi bacterium]|nr:CDP-alcohol phosphatidyltransferase family protein [Chloroflexota bacterium]
MLEQLRHTRAYRVTDAAGRLLARLGLTANGITVLGFLLSMGAAYLIAVGYLAWAALVVVAAGICDVLDGALARLRGSSKFGALLDSTLDRLSEGALLFGVMVFYGGQGDTGKMLLTYVALVGSVLVSYIRARGESLGLSYKGGLLTRAERIVVLVLGLLLNSISGGRSLVAALWLLMAFSYFTSAQRLWYFYRHAGDK